MDEPDVGDMNTATLMLARLDRQAAELRQQLAQWAPAGDALVSDVDPARAALLLEANERLVLAALDARTLADAAASKLGDLIDLGQRDALTGTPNRALMRDRIDSAMSLARRHNKQAALLFLDLDGFKQINDRLGHAAGDDVLKLVAHRLEAVVRDSDTVSRHGGDEFLVLLSEVSRPADARLIADNMVSVLAAPCRVAGQEMRLSASLGIAIYPDDGQDADALIRHADAAMYCDKPAASKGPNARLPSRWDEPRPTAETQPPPDGSAAADLREANEQLALAALAAQRQAARSERAHSRQIAVLAGLVQELHGPLGALQKAVSASDAQGGSWLANAEPGVEIEVANLTRIIDALRHSLQSKSGAAG